MLQFLQSESTAARRRIPVYLVDDADGKTPETGITFSAGDIKVSKNGGAEANHGGTVTELAGGMYYYEATSGELDTLGFLSIRFTKSGVRTFVAAHQVIAIDLNSYNAIADAVLARTLGTESYASDGSVPTLAQMLFMIWSGIAEFAISGTTLTCKKLDGSTTAMTFTLDSSTAPTSRTRAT